MAGPALLVLGLGNVLCGDDGLGIEAVRRLLEAYGPSDGVQVLDGGTLGLALLGWVAEAETLLLVDAVRDDRPPGTLVRLDGWEVAPAVRERLSPHQVGVADLFDGLELLGRTPSRVVLWGAVPARLELCTTLSPAVEAALPALVDAVVAEAAALGHELLRRDVARQAPALAAAR
jgi:hydrogenase maturation protease